MNSRLRVETLEGREVPATLSTFLTDDHIDVNVGFTGGAGGSWSIGPRDDETSTQHTADEALLYVSSAAAASRPGGSEHDFIGVGPGETYFLLPETQNPDVLYLGIAGDGIAAGTLDQYDPSTESGGRAAGSGRWARLTLTGMSGPGEFSLWKEGDTDPVVFMSTADGVSAADSAWVLGGGHGHYNWGFTQPGRYEVTLTPSGYLNDGNTTSLGTPTTGQPVTLYFSVGNVGQVTLDAATYQESESSATATITVNRVGGADGRITVNYATGGGTATAGVDFTAVSGTLTFNDLETTKTITVPILNDSTDESNETVALTLSNPRPAALDDYLIDVEGDGLLGATTAATLSILNDDAPGDNTPPSISDVADSSTDEDTPTGDIAFTVGDPQSATDDLVVTATSSDQALVPDANIVVGGSGPNRTVTITPIAERSGTTTITLTVTDTGGLTASETFVLTVDPANDPPTADDQDVSTPEDVALPITLTGSDPEDDPLTFAIVSGPANGMLTGTGATRTYTPNAGYNGPDSFTFTSNDGSAASAPATVTITVTTESPPTPVADAFVRSTGNLVRGNVLANDTDVDGDPLTATVETGPANGTLDLAADGSFTYTPNAGFAGGDSFTYRVTNDTGRSTVTTATIEPAGFQAFETILAEGDIDIGLAYEGGWDLHIHDEEAEAEYEPDGALFSVPAAARTTRPAGSEFDFLGVAAGEDYYRLPATQNPELVYLGIGTEEIEEGTFVGGGLTVTLKAVNGPGHLSLWRSDILGPVVSWSTVDGIAADDAFTILEGSHEHYNWGFSAKGRYEVTLEARGVLVDGGAEVAGEATYYFSVDNLGQVSFEQSTFGIVEGQTGTLTLVREEGSDGPATVDYVTTFGTATAADLTAATGSVTFLDGETTKTISVTTTKDKKKEPVETATVTLTAAGVVPVGTVPEATVAIDSTTALKVKSIKLNDGLKQRSNVETIAIKFSRDTNLPALIAAGTANTAIKVFAGVTEVPLSADRFVYDAASNTLYVGLTTAGLDPESATILADGRYEVRVDASVVTSSAGGVALTDTKKTRLAFHRLFGDLSGDAKVTRKDEALLRKLLGTYSFQRKYQFAYDLTADGAIDQDDADELRTLLGGTV